MTTARIVVDSSAIIAIIRGEPEHAEFIAALSQSRSNLCSMVTLVESFMVATSRHESQPISLHLRLLENLGIEPVTLDRQQALLAAEAFLRFGKGRHPARLNLGDCFSYALARSLEAPLLYKGEDFGRTDIVPALQGARP